MEKSSDDVTIKTSSMLEYLKCPICFDFLNEPQMEMPCQHIFCTFCLLKSQKSDDMITLVCPICKDQIEYTVIPRLAVNLLSQIIVPCKFRKSSTRVNCDWVGTIQEQEAHKKKCPIQRESRNLKIKEICNKMRGILNLEITPHLTSAHFEIFNIYVRNWEWLETDKKDWKWWWWARNEWWHNQHCEKCIEVWTKYDDEMQALEDERILLLKELEESI